MLTRRLLIQLSAAALGAPLVHARALPGGAVRALEASVEAEMARLKIPGLTAAVGDSAGVRWSKGFGMADLENAVPAKPATAYRLASISKPITAVAALQLWERGKLDLDAPIQKYVPSFPEKGRAVTARLLLAHLAGIRHYRDQAEVDSTRHYSGLMEPLQIFAADPLVAEPGTRFSYTTYGYVLLGAAVEAAAGMPFLEYLRERIFLPARMKTIRGDDVYAIIPNRARGYRRSPSGEWENCALADTSNKAPGGGLISTASDLVEFALALNEGKLLARETLGLMFAPQRTADGKEAPYGLGWYISALNGRKWVQHSGGQQGVSTMLILSPDRDFAAAVMANLEGADVGRLAFQVAAILLP